MEPIGTITEYFPFLSQDTIVTVNQIMNNAENYRDFVIKIIDSIEELAMSEELAQFAVVHASLLGWGLDREVWGKLVSRCKEHFSVYPWYYFNNPPVSVSYFYTDLADAVDRVITSDVSDWLTYHAIIRASWISSWKDHFRWLEIASQLVESNDKLVCLTPHQYHLQAYVKRREGDFESLIEDLEKGLRIAIEFDDVHAAAVSQNYLGEYQMDSNPEGALPLMDQALRTFEQLGDNASANSVALNMGQLHRITGEYDLSLRFFQWGWDISSNPATSQGVRGSWIAKANAEVYNDLGMPNQALEWISWNERDFGVGRLVELERARAYSLLGNHTEAKKSFESVSPLILRSGIDVDLAKYNFALGLHEMSQNNLETAHYSLAQALQEFERLNYQSLINQCLIALTRLEIKEQLKLKDPKDSDTSGPWMTRLGDHAYTKKYPGIQMQYALLKANYQTLIGDEDSAHETLREALTITESPGVSTLRERINKELLILEERC